MITVFVPALNEEANLPEAIRTILRAGESAKAPLEVIIVNDGSHDKTGEVADRLARANSNVSVIHHASNMGLGYGFLEVLKMAKSDRLTLFPGDNMVTSYTFTNLLKNAYRADFVGSFIMNTEARGTFRHLTSILFSQIYTISFGLHLKYIHATPVYSVPKLRKLRLRSQRYSLFSEMNVKLLRTGASFLEIEGYMNPRSTKSSALRMGNFYEVLTSFLRLFLEVYFVSRGEYSKSPKRVIPEEAQQ